MGISGLVKAGAEDENKNSGEIQNLRGMTPIWDRNKGFRTKIRARLWKRDRNIVVYDKLK